MSKILIRRAMAAAMIASLAVLPGFSGWQAGTQGSLSYQLFVPDNYSASSSYALVTHLYGAGSRGTDGRTELLCKALTTAGSQAANPCFVLSPRCETNQKWVDTDWALGTYRLPSVPISDEMTNVIAAVNAICTQYAAIDKNRLHVAGGSMGGYGSWDAIMRYPSMFASATPLSGAGDTAVASTIIHVPVWAFCYSNDPVTPNSGSIQMIRAVRKSGGYPRFDFVPGYPHLWDQVWNAGDQAYRPEQIPWMLRQVKSTAVPVKVTGLTATADGSYRVNLSWQPSSDAVGDPKRIHYLIYRDGKVLGGTDTTRYDSTGFADIDSSLRENTAYRYVVKAFNDNSYVSPASDEATVTTPADIVAPTLIDATDVGDSTKVLATFSERLDPTSAQSTANYSLSPALVISGAKIQAGARSVLLTVAPMTLHASYTLTINNVKDQTGRNGVAANSKSTFNYDYRKGLLYQYYELATGATSTAVLATAAVTRTGIAPYAQPGDATPRSTNFGVRLFGKIRIDQPGDYTFALANGHSRSKININGALTVDTDLPSAGGYDEGTVRLSRGKHDIEILYVKEPGFSGTAPMEFYWRTPGVTLNAWVPNTIYLHNPDAGPPTAAVPFRTSASAPEISLHARFSVSGGSVTIIFSLPQTTTACLSVYDLRGRCVRTLVNNEAAAGTHRVILDRAQDGLGNGRYLVRFQTAKGAFDGAVIIGQ